jgi:methylenetetrahydrofolate reductase (NADPH)
VAQEGLNLCSEIISQVKAIPGVAGVHVMAFNWEDAIPEILERAGLSRRQASVGSK